jgi:hypothetical protein
MPILTLEELIVSLIDLNYTAEEISYMPVNVMYDIIYNQIAA